MLPRAFEDYESAVTKDNRPESKGCLFSLVSLVSLFYSDRAGEAGRGGSGPAALHWASQ
jgi:hypothetical protein